MVLYEGTSQAIEVFQLIANYFTTLTLFSKSVEVFYIFAFLSAC